MNTSLLKKYLDEEGKVTIYPSKSKNKMLIVEYLASKFELDRSYTEKEVNEILKQYHTFNDWALLRKDLFEAEFLGRSSNGSVYWKIECLKFNLQ